MNNVKILILDDKEGNTKTTRQTLEDSFNIKDQNLFPQNMNDEITNLSIKIKKHAEDNSIEEFAGWLNDYIEDKDIDIIILDLALTTEEHNGKIENTSGITLVNSFINKYSQKNHLKYIPIILFSAMLVEDLSSMTKANTVYALRKPKSYNTETAEKLFKRHNLISIVEKHATKYQWLKDNNCFNKNNTFDYDLAIVCALEEEYKHIKNLPVKWEITMINGIQYDTTVFKLESCNLSRKKEIRVVAKAMENMGMVEAAIFSQKILIDCKPQYIAMSGIAAGIRDSDLKLGDILIPHSVYNWQSGKFKLVDKESIFDREPKKLGLEKIIKNAISDYMRATRLDEDDEHFIDLSKFLRSYQKKYDTDDITNVPRIFTEEMVSGSAVVADGNLVKDNIKNRGVVGIDMEAYGVLYAAHEATKFGAEAIVIKGICDFADEDKEDSYHKYAGYVSAQVLYELFIKYVKYS